MKRTEKKKVPVFRLNLAFPSGIFIKDIKKLIIDTVVEDIKKNGQIRRAL